MLLLGWGRQGREGGTEEDMPRGGETLEASCATVPSSSLVTLLRNKCRSSSERTRVCEREDEAALVCEWEGGSRQASVCFCAAEGEGQAAAQCSAQLLSKLVFLSLSPPVSLSCALSPLGWACSVCLSTTGSGEPPRSKAGCRFRRRGERQAKATYRCMLRAVGEIAINDLTKDRTGGQL